MEDMVQRTLRTSVMSEVILWNLIAIDASIVLSLLILWLQEH